MSDLFTRRRMLQLGLAVPAALLVACSSDGEPVAQTTPTATDPNSTPATTAPTTLTPTPSCDDGDDATPAQTEGPYFTPNSPERSSLLGSGVSGTHLLLTGAVVATDCRPVAQALVDFWQADDSGAYDNSGYKLRGHQFTDAQGRYSLTTIMPGIYPGRTRHIHVKVQAPGESILTTQLYFPGQAGNASDGIYRKECEMDIADAANGKAGTFTFVLDV
ncbi:MAG: dioxygenase [Actinomycetota bacterium]